MPPTYDSAGNLHSVTDHLSGETTMYRYDLSGKLVHSYVYDNESMRNVSGVMLRYDGESRVTNAVYSYDYTYSGGSGYFEDQYRYEYDTKTGDLSEMTVYDGKITGNIYPIYDRFGRIVSRTVQFDDALTNIGKVYQTQTYDFETDESGNNQSILVSQMINTVVNGESGLTESTTTYQYDYDDNGNITQIADGNDVVQNRYEYDNLNQLIREDNRAKNATYVYTYDDAGNITSKKTYAFTTGALGTVQKTDTFYYNNSTWGDLLTSYGGAPISYDAIGNPTLIDLDSLTWQGRELQSYNDGEYEISFEYNADGIRTIKDVCELTPGVTMRHSYTLSGSRIIGETVYYYFSETSQYEQCRLVYLYDETGAPIGMKYRTPSYAQDRFDYYFFEKNLQGDIIAIYGEDGTKLCSYAYDAWGNATVTYHNSGAATAAFYNPFRYRGYYYDEETGFYYLQSRYYNPTWGRFINADKYVSTGQGLLGCNMFAYCINNPISFRDMTGCGPEAVQWWAGTMWWLCGTDAFLPIGDVIYISGMVIIGIFTIDCVDIDARAEIITQMEIYDEDKYDDYYDDEEPRRKKIGKPKGNTPGSNQYQNRQFKNATRGLKKDVARTIHDTITKQGYGYKEILEEAKKLLILAIVWVIGPEE